MLRSAVVCALAAFAGLAEAAIECKDMSGRATDYFVAMKFPRSEGTTTLQKQGMGFAYTDPKAAFADTRESLAGKSHALAATLNQIYNAKSGSGLSFVMYDDEAMDKSSGTLAHAKGVLAYDAAGGFWLVHSTPNWPPVKAYDFPISEADYGQSYLCLTLNKESVKNALTQLKTINPLVYNSANPSNDATLQGIIDRKGYPTAPTLSTLPITTRGGAKFNSIYKNKEWGKELYGDAVAPAYPGNTFYVETWQNGVGFMPDDCAKKVQNVIGVRGSPEVTWKSSEDHSKWAVTPKGSKNKVACIGGINRQASQSRRGGGTVCTSEPTVYNALLGMVNGVENCNGDNILRQNGKDKSM